MFSSFASSCRRDLFFVRLRWHFEDIRDGKDGRRAAMGGSDGKLYIYDIGDMAIPRESEWTDMQRTISSMIGGVQGAATVAAPADTPDPSRSVSGR